MSETKTPDGSTTNLIAGQKNGYDKMPEYIHAVFNVFRLVNEKADNKKNQRMKMIGLVMFNYVRYMAGVYNVDMHSIPEQNPVNLIAIFEYIAHNEVKLYDFENINPEEVDVRKNEDLERYVLTHIYYITQAKKEDEDNA